MRTQAKEAGELFAAAHNVRMLLVEPAVDIAREIYLSMTVDPVSGTALLMGCAEGGVDIESLCRHAAGKIVTRACGRGRGTSAAIM